MQMSKELFWGTKIFICVGVILFFWGVISLVFSTKAFASHYCGQPCSSETCNFVNGRWECGYCDHGCQCQSCSDDWACCQPGGDTGGGGGGGGGCSNDDCHYGVGCCSGRQCYYNGSDWYCDAADNCSNTGPEAPQLVSPADGTVFPVGNVTVSWYDAIYYQNNGGYWYHYETCWNTDCHCNGCWIWTHWAGCCYESCDGRQCEGHDTWITNPPTYYYNWGGRNCSMSGSQTYTSGTFIVFAGPAGNVQEVGRVNYSGQSSYQYRQASYTIDISRLSQTQTNYWYVMAVNPASATATSSIRSFSFDVPKVSVSGTVYEDLYQGAGGLTKCTGPGGTPIKPGGGSKVTVAPDNREGPVQGNGTYSVSQVADRNPKTITLTGTDSGFSCTCPANCQYLSASITGGNNTGWNFYGGTMVAKWAQIVAGHIYGHEGGRVTVPAGKYLLINGSFSNNPGSAAKSSGSFTVSPGGLSSTGWDLSDSVVSASWRYSYQRLWIQAGSPATDPGDGTAAPAAGVYRRGGDWTAAGSSWTGLSGSRIIFVDGDVNVNAKISLAGSTDFIAIIASGDLSVNPAIGDLAIAGPSPAEADLTGVFLANGNFNGGSTQNQRDKQLVIYGTVGADIDLDGGGSVNFQRDMGLTNAAGPGVSVIWNPNLLLNVPDQLKDALTDWREVAP